jgi:DNA-directed RNA polymerase subunit omega
VIDLKKCLHVVPSPFWLVVYAAQRARSIASGSPIRVERLGDRNSVVSLREIEDSAINVQELHSLVVANYQQVVVWPEDE